MDRTGGLQWLVVSLKAASCLNCGWLKVVSSGEAELEEDQEAPLHRLIFLGLLRTEPNLLLFLLSCL